MIAGQNNNRQPPCFLSRIFISVIAGRCNNIHAKLIFHYLLFPFHSPGQAPLRFFFLTLC